MVGWHHRLKGQESEQTLGDSEGQGSLACCSPWCPKESDTTKLLKDKCSQIPKEGALIYFKNALLKNKKVTFFSFMQQKVLSFSLTGLTGFLSF